MIDRDTINRIMDAANIVEVVSDFMTLRRSGANYKGLCPFHNEKTPSFMVSPAKGIYHCFGCGKGGTAVGFVMDHEQMTYPEALHWLANKYHIPIKEREQTDEEKQEQSLRESLFIVNERAAKYFQEILHNHPGGQSIGMAYFRNRGFRDDIIERFGLGYALPDRNSLGSQFLKEGYKKEFLVATGLCGEREDGSLYDRFAGRVIFPWYGVSGKTVAFGGRLLDSRTKGVNQKYINSPESSIYHKDRELYGIFQAKRAIVKEDCVYMVEGYTDVISMHQCGIENVVANSGTALSMHQVRLLHRFTANIVLLYDGDAAGIHAALRGTDMLLGEGMNVKVLLLPDGNDPDSFAREKTSEEFKAYVQTHQVDFIQFKMQLLLEEAGSDPIKRASLIKSMVQSIAVIPDAIVRSVYIQECSHSMGTDEKILTNEVAQLCKRMREEKAKARLSASTVSPTEASTPTPEKGVAESSAAPAPPTVPSAVLPHATTPLEQKEFMLTKAIVRWGDKHLGGEDEEGQQTPTVTEFIHDVLEADEIVLQTSLYRQILNEAYDHRMEEIFECPRYFLNHPDPVVNAAAIQMIAEPYQLSRLFKKAQPGNASSLQKEEGSSDREAKSDASQPKEEETDLGVVVPHICQEFRLAYIQQKIKEVLLQMKSIGTGQDDEFMHLMQQLKDLQTIERILALQVGERVVL